MLEKFARDVASRKLRVRGIEVYQHGEKLAVQRWAPNLRYPVHSVSKSFTQAAIGMLADAGRLSVSERVIDLFPECVPDDRSPHLDEITVEHLLTMTTGHTAPTNLDPEAGLDEDDGVRLFMRRPVEEEPGTRFFYNNGASFVLSAIVTRLSGQSVRDFLMPRLFAPLCIENPAWTPDPHNRSMGYTGLMLSTSELARFGLLYLNRGVFEGTRILSEKWVDKSGSALVDTTPHKDGPDNAHGYGYQFWRCVPAARAYRADGSFGQFVVVSNPLDAVIAVSSWDVAPQRILTALWNDVTPILEERL